MKSTRTLVRRRLKDFPEKISDFSIEQCIDLVRLALVLDAKNPELNYYMAYFYAVAGKPSQALVYVRRSLKFGFRSIKKITHAGVFKGVRELKGFPHLIATHLAQNQ